MEQKIRRQLYFKGRMAYSFGKNGEGLSDEFELINSLTRLFSANNRITIHKSFVDQTDDVYDLIFDIEPKDNVNYLFNDNDEVESKHRSKNN